MDSLYTGSGREIKAAFPQRAKMSGASKGVQRVFSPEVYRLYNIIVLDREGFNPRKRLPPIAEEIPEEFYDLEANYNGALVDNWHI